MALSDPVLTASLFSTTAVTGPATASTTTVAATAASDVSIAGVMIHGASPPDSAVITGGGLTWTKVVTVTYSGSGNHRLTIFKAQGVIASGGTITFGPGGTFVTTGQDLILAKCPGASPTQVQFKTAAAATDPITVTADVAPGASNLVLLFGSMADVTAYSSGTGTELADGTHATPSCRTGLYWDRTSPANPMTMTNGIGAAWAAASVELTEYIAPVAGSYAAEVNADSPVAWWRLGEASGNALDELGASPGVVTGSPSRNVAGLINATDDDGAIDFDGTDDEIDGTNAWSALGAAWSIEAWFDVDVIQNGDVIFVVGGDIGPTLRFNASSKLELVWRDSGSVDRILASTATILVDTLYHVIATHTGSTTTIYLNGISDATTGSWDSKVLVATANAFDIGHTGGSFNFDGKIDELALYASSLSLARIQAHYIAGLGRVPATRRFAQLLAH